MVTLTTVGYGDITPVTDLGFVVGAMCAVSGTILFALTIPVLSNNFAMLYAHARSRQRGLLHRESIFTQLGLDLTKRSRGRHICLYIFCRQSNSQYRLLHCLSNKKAVLSQR